MDTCWIAEAYWPGQREPQRTLAARTREDLADWIKNQKDQGFQVQVRQGSGPECAGLPEMRTDRV